MSCFTYLSRFAGVRAFRRLRYRLLEWLLTKSPTGRVLVLQTWFNGFDTGSKLMGNREQRRAAARRAVRP